jgi:PAS domain S-box-containing protein
MAHATILVVEDENIIAIDIQQRLQSLGYAVPTIAASGLDALQKAADLCPDLVLMDIVLKGDMDGIETAEQVRTQFQIPVVYLTAYADEGTWQRALATAPFGYVLKPLVDRQLQTVIEIALAKHRLEKQIAESAKWFSTTLRCVGDAVIATNTNGQVTFMNPRAEALTGWPQADALGTDVDMICRVVNEDTPTAVATPLRQAMRTGELVQLGHARGLLIARDGTTIPIDASAAPIRDDQGVLLGGVLVFRDVTERRRTEEALLTARKLEAIGTLAGGIAHTFNNLLTVMLGRLSLAQLHARQHEPLQAHLREAEQAAQRATEVTRQLLTFAKGGAPVKRLLPLGPVLQEAIQGALADAAGPHVVALAEDLWPVEMDSGQIRQAMDQVVRNAVEATAAGGTIEVRADNVTLPEAHHAPLAPGAWARISVIDQGAGIAAAHLDQIFDPYFTTKGHGGGLGLATAHAIVQHHGGSIQVVSAPGAGTTVHMYLPARPTVAEPGRPPLAAVRTGQHKILVMDDEEGIRGVLSTMLTSLGYESTSAREGTEALALYRGAQEAGTPFAAVILDLVVADGMGGQEAIARLRELDPQVKAIVSSGYSTDAVMADFQRYGFSGVLAKPYRLAELSALLQHVVHHPHP